MKKLVLVYTLILTCLFVGTAFAGFNSVYSNSEVSGNDGADNTQAIAVLSPNNFVLTINDAGSGFGLQKWTNASATTGRGNNVTVWSYSGDNVTLTRPNGVAADGSNRVFVANNDANHNILVFDASGADPVATQYRIALGGSADILGLDVDDNGYVYICSTANASIQIYPGITDAAWTGTHSLSPTRTVSLPVSPLNFCVNNAGTEIYVCDSVSKQVLKYTGSVASGFTQDGGFSLTGLPWEPQAVAVRDNVLFVTYGRHSPVGLTTYTSARWITADAFSGIPIDVMYFGDTASTSYPYDSSDTTAGYYSPRDLELDSEGNVYINHFYAWAIEKYVGVATMALTPDPVPSRLLPGDTLIFMAHGGKTPYANWTTSNPAVGVMSSVGQYTAVFTAVGNGSVTVSVQDNLGTTITSGTILVTATDAPVYKDTEAVSIHRVRPMELFDR
ncbi:MAG: hypothetical protein ACE14V_06115 [bacterium]